VVIPLSGRVPGRASGPSRSRVDDGGGSRCVSGKLIGSLGFSHWGVFIGEGAAPEVSQGALTIGGCGPGVGDIPNGYTSDVVLNQQARVAHQDGMADCLSGGPVAGKIMAVLDAGAHGGSVDRPMAGCLGVDA
jgi:hypothetical protein